MSLNYQLILIVIWWACSICIFLVFLKSAKVCPIKSLNVSFRVFFSHPNHLLYWTSISATHHLSNSLSSNSISIRTMRMSQTHLYTHFISCTVSSALHRFSADFTSYFVLYISFCILSILFCIFSMVLGPFSFHFIFHFLFHTFLT